MQKILLLLLSLIIGFSLEAQNITEASTTDNGVVFTIRYQNKQVYYPQSDVIIKASIRNVSSYDYVFELADESLFNVDLSVKTLTNMELPPSDVYIRRTKSNETRPILYRLVNLKSGEEHSFEINLRDYVKITDPDTYIIQANFRPFAALKNEYISFSQREREMAQTLTANSLSLTVRPFYTDQTFTDQIDHDTNEILQQEILPPDQVVSYVLEARQAEQWNKFFLYIDLEKIFLNNSDRSRRYNYADIEEKSLLLKAYKQNLIASDTDTELSTIPYTFKIISTYYTEDIAQVTTRQSYRQKQYDDVKEFVWFLRRNPDTKIWVIYNYEVTNLGTERE